MGIKKYEYTKGEALTIKGHILYRIRALIDIPVYGVKAGDLGGFIETEDNLSHEGNSWVSGNATVYGKSLVSDNAWISKEAIVFDSNLKGDVVVSGKAMVWKSDIKGTGLKIIDDAVLEYITLEFEDSRISGKSILKNIFGRSMLTNFTMKENTQMKGLEKEPMLMGGDRISISGRARLIGINALLGSDISISDDVSIGECVTVNGQNIQLSDYASVIGKVTLRQDLRLSELAHICSSKGTSQIGEMELSGDSIVDASLL